MTISSNTRKAGPFVGNYSTTAFPFTFKVFAAGDLLVVRANSSGAESTLVLNSDYTVSLNSNQDASPGGSVNLPAALATGYRLTITSAVQNLQSLDLTNQGGFYPKTINQALDRATIQIQQIGEQAGRSLKYPISDSGGNPTIPGKDQRKGRVLAFHETSGDPVQGPTITAVNTVAGAVAAIQTVADDLNEPVSEIATVAASIGNVDAVGNNISNVNTIVPHLAKIDTVADDLNEPVSEIATVAASIGNVDAVGNNISNVNSVAGNEANINTVAGSIGNVNAVASNSANINTVAGSIANVNAVGNNIANVNAAVANEANINAAPSYASAAQAAAAYLQTYMDQVVATNITFPLDLGLISDTVLYNHFDLGVI